MDQLTTVVRVDDVSKRFVIRKDKSLKERLVNVGRSRRHKDDFWALRNVSLEIPSGTTVGLVGPNGSGKSTLLKLIGGIVPPTTGAVTRRGRLAALIELGAGFHPDLTGRENVYLNCSILGLSREQTARHFDSIVDFSGVERFIDTQVKFYSSGMYIRLAFAVAVHVDPDLLLVDEVLAVGDEPFQRKCMDRIRSFQNDGRTIVIVSHALDQIAELCDRVVVLERGQVQVDDEPLVALRHLRADFEESRKEERERERMGDSGQHTTRAHITDVRVTSHGRRDSSTIAPGDPLAIHIDVVADEELTGWILGIALHQNGGQMVFGTNTKLMGVELPAFRGERTFTVRFPHVWLGEGFYSVQAAIAEHSGVEIDRVPDACSLSVEGDGRSIGTLYSQPTVSSPEMESSGGTPL
jgi:ABC-2 type transport system ATP-binding protein